jgi:hypothetical protein
VSEQDLDEEIGFHVEMQTRKNLALGMSAAGARRQARIQFGVGDAVKEECRDVRGVGFIETLLQDIRYALRGFRRTPLFALTVVGTIALGLGWNTAVFTIFNAYVLRPLPVCVLFSGLGIAFGSMLALAASKLISAVSSQVAIDPFDRLAYSGGMALVLTVCICAAYVPAGRAARVDPIATLRYD